jgi:SOS response regulatory protein OraA/RecX
LVVIQAQNRIASENIRSAASIQDSVGPQQAAKQVLRPWGTTKRELKQKNLRRLEPQGVKGYFNGRSFVKASLG